MGDLLQENMLFRARMGELGRQSPSGKFVTAAFEDPGTQGVEPLDFSKIKHDPALARLPKETGCEAFDLGRMLRRPATDESGPRPIAGSFEADLRLVSQGALRHG
jgi:hypothetical protein